MRIVSGKLAFALFFALSLGLVNADQPSAPVVIVSGYILTAGTGAPVSHADVKGSCIDPSGDVTDTFSEESGGNGHYSKPFRCHVGDTVRVDVSKNGNSAFNSSVVVGGHVGSDSGDEGQCHGHSCPESADNYALHSELDVYLIGDVQLPEFSSPVVPVFLSILSFGLVRLRKRKQALL